jgi:hypothetical protein
LALGSLQVTCVETASSVDAECVGSREVIEVGTSFSGTRPVKLLAANKGRARQAIISKLIDGHTQTEHDFLISVVLTRKLVENPTSRSPIPARIEPPRFIQSPLSACIARHARPPRSGRARSQPLRYARGRAKLRIA